MSRLRIFNERDPATPERVLEDHDQIGSELARRGVRFERWQAAQPVAPGAAPQEVIEAYHDDIERLRREGGYQAVDVISIAPDHPEREALRRKFLDEHIHGEDEVRFFVAGSGLFTLHLDEQVYEVHCEAGDLIGLPAGTRHWFDMGPQPSFVAIRLFTNPEGWVARFTGTDIAQKFPRFE
ncbi:MAG TPA: acireductone dioxygenase [Xanthomonadaceae bacterium]|nr:acireductone dioxygenase [Xanthomonadaceae bacterium]